MKKRRKGRVQRGGGCEKGQRKGGMERLEVSRRVVYEREGGMDDAMQSALKRVQKKHKNSFFRHREDESGWTNDRMQ